jgi:hypothetical protein
MIAALLVIMCEPPSHLLITWLNLGSRLPLEVLSRDADLSVIEAFRSTVSV